MTTSYADSPSRQVRRSARVASLSPSSFTPLISEQQLSGISSASSSTSSSYMPSSPSSKYSMMRGGYNGVSIDEIVINEILPENRNGPKSKQFYPTLESYSTATNLRSNPERKHPTLDFQPTNLGTPSTSLLSSSSDSQGKSGITPAVKQINLQETPGQSQRVLERLVSKVDMEEIAKATPLGNYYNRKAAGFESNATTGAEKSKIQIIHSKATGNSTTVNSTAINHSNQQAYNLQSMAQKRTPPKQTSTTDLIDNSDETVKVVRTLRNRSIVASPLPVNSSLRRASLSASALSRPKIDVTVLFKKHQKNLLAYSLAGLFLLATLYHIYEGLRTVEPVGELVNEPVKTFTVPPPPAVPIVASAADKDEILKLIDSKLTEIKADENEKILNLFEQVRESLNQKLESVTEAIATTTNNNRPEDFELQKKALDSVANTVKSLERKFQTLEARIEAVRNERIERKPEPTHPKLPTKPQNLHLNVIKHLTTNPLYGWGGGGFFRSYEFPPENAVNPSTSRPFQFPGNRGKLAVILDPQQQQQKRLPAQLTIDHPLLPDRSCAPRDIEVWALPNVLNERDRPVLLAKGSFDLSRPSQSFPLNQEKLAKLSVDKPIVLQLRIRNNHGNPRLTCLYKLAVTN